jgi:Kef-type K+ transport system membrane component KefB
MLNGANGASARYVSSEEQNGGPVHLQDASPKSAEKRGSADASTKKATVTVVSVQTRTPSKDSIESVPDYSLPEKLILKVRRSSKEVYQEVAAKDKPYLIALFTFNLLCGLFLSQVFHGSIGSLELTYDQHHMYVEVVSVVTMLLLAFIMVGVGCEFVIDKSNLSQYVTDYLVAMTAAGFPWLFVGAWFAFMIPNPLWWGAALFAARFAAPTSAGILFTMLKAAGLEDTWLFRKARVLAIFDDLDTILFMLPLKVIVTGFQWELGVDFVLVCIPLMLAWRYMHKLSWPTTWYWRILYSVLVVGVCECLYYGSKYVGKHPPHPHFDHMAPVHLEVLLPAFVIGCLLKTDEEEEESECESRVATSVSAFFMLCVGLSTPKLVLEGEKSVLRLEMAGHVAVVTVLMIAGKMFPLICYREEADWQTRLALSLGMCPRGEVGAGIIVIAIESGIEGTAIELAVVCLAINLILSGAFVTWTRQLAHASEARIRAKEEAEAARRKRKKKKKKKKEKLHKSESQVSLIGAGEDPDSPKADLSDENLEKANGEEYPYNLDPHSPSHIHIVDFDDDPEEIAPAK